MGGTGQPRRELLHVEWTSRRRSVKVFPTKTYSGEMQVNVGSGEDQTILKLAQLVCDVVGFRGEIVSDLSIPDGMLRKLMSTRRLRAMGWAPAPAPESRASRDLYEWFLANAVVPA